MSVILIANVRAARTAQNLADMLSNDPLLQRAARTRALAEVMRREQRLRNPQPAEVIDLDTRRRRPDGAGWIIRPPRDY